MKTIVRERYDAAGNLVGKEVERIYDDQPWYTQPYPYPVTIPAYPYYAPYQITCSTPAGVAVSAGSCVTLTGGN